MHGPMNVKLYALCFMEDKSIRITNLIPSMYVQVNRY